jgi:hypothetical protein
MERCAACNGSFGSFTYTSNDRDDDFRWSSVGRAIADHCLGAHLNFDLDQLLSIKLGLKATA